MATDFAFTSDEFATRRRRVQEALETANLDAILAYSTHAVQANVRYLANYWVRFSGMQTRRNGTYYMFGSCACLMSRDAGDPVVRTDQPWDVDRCRQISVYPDAGFSESLAGELGPIIRARGYRRVGIDNWYVFPAKEFVTLQNEAPGTEFVSTHLLSEVRRVKSPSEIAIMRRAAEVGRDAVRKALDAVRVGGSEFEISLLCEYEMRAGGDLHCSGESIGGCGPNTSTGSSLPSRYNDRKMRAGEWVMLDVCPRVEGYCADVSRHRLVGEEKDLDRRLRALYDACALMNEEVLRVIRPGVTGRQLNELAQEVATASGFGEYKIDLLGHGLGIDIQDIPDFYYDDSPWQVGEVIAVEPCLLIPGVAGVRIEDDVLITETGVDVLTESWRGLTPEH